MYDGLISVSSDTCSTLVAQTQCRILSVRWGPEWRWRAVTRNKPIYEPAREPRILRRSSNTNRSQKRKVQRQRVRVPGRQIATREKGRTILYPHQNCDDCGLPCFPDLLRCERRSKHHLLTGTNGYSTWYRAAPVRSDERSRWSDTSVIKDLSGPRRLPNAYGLGVLYTYQNKLLHAFLRFFAP
ncbi:hypothetical protein BJV77DRAFT_475904 [Russula vinacea]|nr:hypothetical protein BJV77DRAFT_475904 [Russula vinacea]